MRVTYRFRETAGAVNAVTIELGNTGDTDVVADFTLNTDRVQVVKWESAALGGDGDDEVAYATPLDVQEDLLECAGLLIQHALNRDKDVKITRDTNTDNVKVETGILRREVVEHKTAAYTILEEESGKVFGNDGASGSPGSRAHTLPSATVGMRYTFVASDNGGGGSDRLQIDSTGAEPMYQAGSSATTWTSGTGGGHAITFVCHVTGEWTAMHVVGTWT